MSAFYISVLAIYVHQAEDVLTWEKKLEKGKPWSRAKAQASRDAHARSPKVENMRPEINVQTMAVVAFLDPVAVRNIWIIGYLVGLCRASVISPIPNKIAIEKATAMTPLGISAITMLRGTTTAESVTSSPIRELLADMLSRRPYF